MIFKEFCCLFTFTHCCTIGNKCKICAFLYEACFSKRNTIFFFWNFLFYCSIDSFWLEKNNWIRISIEIIDLRTLSPLDTETILASVQKTGRVVIAHEAQRTLGMAS